MTTTYLQLTPHDPLVARDGRPFGAGQGQRMRSLPWLLPSVVAGSFRTALVKAGTGDFSGEVPKQLLDIQVAGVFPAVNQSIYLPGPLDCVWHEEANKVHRVQPVKLAAGQGCDFPEGSHLDPVQLTAAQADDDFKPRAVPDWWPINKMADWLSRADIAYTPSWFDESFLVNPRPEYRDHVCIEPETGAAAESLLFATTGLNLTHLARHGIDKEKPWREQYTEIRLVARVQVPDGQFPHIDQLSYWHPLGGERRLVHWKKADSDMWKCPDGIREALNTTTRIRMVLATPAVFNDGWKPGWLTTGLEGDLSGVKLKLVGASNGRWKAVSGWSLADTEKQKRGPKPIRRMVPAGSVYFFSCEKGAASALAARWLQSVSDDDQEQRDGFGLAIWGTW